MLPRTETGTRWSRTAGDGGTSRDAGAASSLPEQLRPRWRRSCVRCPDAAEFAEECLEDWNSHLRGCAEFDGTGGDDSAGGGPRTA